MSAHAKKYPAKRAGDTFCRIKKKGGELIIANQLEYYEKNLISTCIGLSTFVVDSYSIGRKHEEIMFIV